MKLRRLALAPIAAVVIAFGAAGPAAAVMLNYDFGSLFSGSGPSSATFAHLSVATTDYRTFTFDLKIGSDLNSLFGSTGTFVSSLRVNTASNADPGSLGILSGTWGVAQVRLDTTTSHTGGVAWDFIDSFCGSGHACNPNSAASRLTQGEEVEWTTTFTSVQNPPFGTPPFLLKVQGFGNSGEYIGAANPIPEPEIYAMMAAGLGLMGFVARRRKGQAAPA